MKSLLCQIKFLLSVDFPKQKVKLSKFSIDPIYLIKHSSQGRMKDNEISTKCSTAFSQKYGLLFFLDGRY